MNFKSIQKTLDDKKALWQTNEAIFKHLDELKIESFSLGAEPPAGYAEPKILAHGVNAPIAAFAPAVDWRNRFGGNHISPPKQQGGCGSCVSFCTVSVTEAMISIEKGQQLDLSEADQHFCSSHGANCGGWWHTTAFDQIKLRGVSSEASFPYATAFPSGNIWSGPPNCVANPNRNATAVKITNVHVINNMVDAKIILLILDHWQLYLRYMKILTLILQEFICT
ncbi:MAG: hypothetical protein IPO92_12210 [Saprospiraceae bacterium]|nr:hypothetical protein [Saprospiraceae bacterium]